MSGVRQDPTRSCAQLGRTSPLVTRTTTATSCEWQDLNTDAHSCRLLWAQTLDTQTTAERAGTGAAAQALPCPAPGGLPTAGLLEWTGTVLGHPGLCEKNGSPASVSALTVQR
jgi:hypothetical protein